MAQSAGGELGHGMKIAIVGNCQHFGLAACIRLMIPDAEVVGMYGTDPSPPLTNSDLLQSNYAHLLDNADYWDDMPSGQTDSAICLFRFPSGHSLRGDR